MCDSSSRRHCVSLVANSSVCSMRLAARSSGAPLARMLATDNGRHLHSLLSARLRRRLITRFRRQSCSRDRDEIQAGKAGWPARDKPKFPNEQLAFFLAHRQRLSPSANRCRRLLSRGRSAPLAETLTCTAVVRARTQWKSGLFPFLRL